MYSGVPTTWARPVRRGIGREPLAGRLGDAEVDDLGHRRTVLERHQHVGGFQVAVDDPLLVRVLHRPADQHEQLQPLRDRQVILVAVGRDRHAVDQVHHEVGPTRVGGPGVEHAGDVRDGP